MLNRSYKHWHLEREKTKEGERSLSGSRYVGQLDERVTGLFKAAVHSLPLSTNPSHRPQPPQPHVRINPGLVCSDGHWRPQLRASTYCSPKTSWGYSRRLLRCRGIVHGVKLSTRGNTASKLSVHCSTARASTASSVFTWDYPPRSMQPKTWSDRSQPPARPD